MLIYNKKLSVSPITTHLPLKDVHRKITKDSVNSHNSYQNFVKKMFNKKNKGSNNRIKSTL